MFSEANFIDIVDTAVYLRFKRFFNEPEVWLVNNNRYRSFSDIYLGITWTS